MKDFELLRSKMVEEQLLPRSIKSVPVLDAMRNVPRHLFVPENLQNRAYDDCPLPIGLQQTISQPYIVAFMTEILAVPEQLKANSSMKILEIGTGSGYQAAILAYLGAEVYTIELLDELAARAKNVLAALGLDNAKVICGNGYSGWPEAAIFDAIIVTAAPPYIPKKLVEQLKDGGKMIIPVGEVHAVQYLKLITKKDEEIIERNLLPVRFVPMVESTNE